MKTKKYICLFLTGLFAVCSCKEEGRFSSSADDAVPPGPVTGVTYKALYGGARFFFSVPNDEDLLKVDAVYTSSTNQAYQFSVSYFVDSLDVYGFPDVNEYTVQLYAVDRSGNRSTPTSVTVTPLEPAYKRVAQTMVVKPGFSSFILDWENELEQNINVYVDFTYTQNGEAHSFTSVFSSNLLNDRRFINDLYLTPQEPVSIQIRVEDMYGNITESIDKGQIALLEDIELPKNNWFLPETNDSIGGVPQAFGNGYEGRLRYVIDGIIDRGDNLNFMHTQQRGQTGNAANGNMPWNIMIDLGDYYELSRIVTVQRHSGGLANISRGQYYQTQNIGIYNMYVWDDDTEEWVYVSQHQIPVPQGISELEFVKLGEAGDMAYMYPDDPQYTKPTRWFRYEARKGFSGNYTLDDGDCLSEITLYGRKANK
jgi:hypothetical protein